MLCIPRVLLKLAKSLAKPFVALLMLAPGLVLAQSNGTAQSNAAAPANAPAAPLERAKFVVEPEVFVHHTPQRAFIGPGMFRLASGDILMAAPWGRPPTNFKQLAAKFPVPMLYRSRDGGRSWQEQGRLRMEWTASGMLNVAG